MCGANAGAARTGAMHAVSRNIMGCRNNMMATLKCALKLSACTRLCLEV